MTTVKHSTLSDFMIVFPLTRDDTVYYAFPERAVYIVVGGPVEPCFYTYNYTYDLSNTHNINQQVCLESRV